MTLAFVSGSKRVYPFKHVIAITSAYNDEATILLYTGEEYDILFSSMSDRIEQTNNYIKYISQQELTQFE